MLATLLFLAATISSPSIGEIVALPSWMPRSISAANTPGNETNSVPRRIVPATLASAAAAEEAYFERLYYLEAVDKGDSTSLSYLGSYEPTNVIYKSSSPTNAVFPTVRSGASASLPSDRVFPSPPTLRIRWPEYDWVREHLISGVYGIWGLALRTLTGCELLDGTTLYRRSDSIILTSSIVDFQPPAFPEFDWLDAAGRVSALSTWRGGRTFRSCVNDGFFNFYVANRHPPGFETLAYLMSSADYNRFAAAHIVQDAGAYSAALDAAFGSTNGFNYAVVTNGSRRLLYDRMAAFNRIAASVDRTYSEGSLFHTTGGTLTNTHYRVRSEAIGTLPGSAFVIVDGEPGISDGASISWGSTSTTATMETGESPLRVYDCIWQGVSKTMINCYSDAFSPSGPQTIIEATVDPAIFEDPPYPPGTETNVTITIAVYNDSLTYPYILFDVRDAGGYFFGTYDAEIVRMSTTNNFSIVAGAMADYDYTRTAERAPFRPTVVYPAQRAFDSGRIKETETALCWTMYEGEVEFPEDFNPRPGDYLSAKMRCARETCATRRDLQHFVEGEYADMHDLAAERLRLHLGHQPYDWTALESTLSDAVDDVEGSVRLSASVTFTPVTNLVATIRRPRDPGPDTVEFSDGKGVIARWTAVVTASPSSNPPANLPSHAIAIEPSAMQRVDWNFKALRLENN